MFQQCQLISAHRRQVEATMSMEAHSRSRVY